MTHLQARSLTVVNQRSSIDFPGTVPVVPLAGGPACYFLGGNFEQKIVTDFFFFFI